MKGRLATHRHAVRSAPLGVLALCVAACEGSPERQEFWRPWYETGSADPQPDPLPDSGTVPIPLDGGSGPADLASPMSGCRLSVSVTTSAAGGKYAPRNIGAIWISDGDSRFVKTLAVWAEKRAKYLTAWNASTAAAMQPGSRVDAISSATKTAHGLRGGTWNCKDAAGQVRADGPYKVCFELTDRDGAGPMQCVPFNKGAMAWSLTPPDAPSFAATRLEFRP